MTKEKYQNFLVSNKEKWQTNSPCFVINKEQLNTTIENIKNNLPGEIVYSHKTNPHKSITQIVVSHNCGLLLSSIEEAEKLIDEKIIDPGKIIFQSPSLTKDQYEKLKSFGISRFIIDSHEQLAIVLSLLENMSRKPELLIRINTGVTVPHAELDYSSDSYLGFPIADATNVFNTLNELRKEDKIILGLHNHLLSQNTFLDMWSKNLTIIADYVDELRNNGILLDIVDFGGGYPVEYANEVPSLEDISKLILTAINKIKIIYPNINFIFEPGRKVVGESITLITKVVHMKEFKGTEVAILDCSLYNSSMDTLIVSLYLTADKVGENNKKFKDYAIRGSTPDSLDVFAQKINLPELKSGDNIAFFHAGAYSFWSDFISLKKPPHFLV